MSAWAFAAGMTGVAALGWTAWGFQFAAYRRLRHRGYRRAAELLDRTPPQGPPGWMTTRQLEEIRERWKPEP